MPRLVRDFKIDKMKTMMNIVTKAHPNQLPLTQRRTTKSWLKLLQSKSLKKLTHRIPQFLNPNFKAVHLETLSHLVRLLAELNQKRESTEDHWMNMANQRRISTTHQAKWWDILLNNHIMITSTATKANSIPWDRSIRPRCANITSTLVNAH